MGKSKLKFSSRMASVLEATSHPDNDSETNLKLWVDDVGVTASTLNFPFFMACFTINPISLHCVIMAVKYIQYYEENRQETLQIYKETHPAENDDRNGK